MDAPLPQRSPALDPHRPRWPDPRILYEDADLLVIDKPAGLLAVPGRTDALALPDLLRTRQLVRPDEPFRRVHRIDRETSGVIVFARTLAAQRSLTAQFGERTVEKIYFALVQGYVAADGEIDLPLRYRDGDQKTAIERRRGKPSRTRYRILERVAGNTWLECRPLTGRHHQIRAHLAAIGHPLTVDPLYGGGSALLLSTYKPGYRPDRRVGERPLIERLTLHAAGLRFEHPSTGTRVGFEAELPKDLRATLNQLRRLTRA